jgi:hypothetical protein
MRVHIMRIKSRFSHSQTKKKIDVFDRAGLWNRPRRSAHERIPPIRHGLELPSSRWLEVGGTSSWQDATDSMLCDFHRCSSTAVYETFVL